LWFLAEQIFPGFCMEIRESFGRFDGGLAAEAALGGLLLLLGMAIYIIAIFGPYSRLLEHQADLFSLRSLPSGGNIYPVKAIGSALEKLAANGTVNRNKRTWQHASIAGRVDFLNRLDLEPKSELHFQQRMVFANCLVVGIVLSPVVSRLLVG
jgi:Zn-dependent protease with chaperone function